MLRDENVVSEDKEVKDTRARGWLVTIPADRYTRQEIVDAIGGYDVVVAQLEEGSDTGYRHWQTWIENSVPIRFSTLQRKLPGCHLTMRQAPKEKAFAYVTKDDTRVANVARIVIGDPEDMVNESGQGRRSDLERVREAVLEDGKSFDEIMLTLPEAARYSRYVRELIGAREREAARGQRNVEVIYVYGDPGSGKTRWLYSEFDDVCRVTSYGNPFDAYAGQSVLALDEFSGQIDLRLMNSILDRYELNLPARYYDRPARFETVVMISNMTPWSLYSWEPFVVRQAFARRINRVMFMEHDGVMSDIDIGSVRSRFGEINSVTPVAALRAVPRSDIADESLFRS